MIDKVRQPAFNGPVEVIDAFELKYLDVDGEFGAAAELVFAFSFGFKLKMLAVGRFFLLKGS